MRTVKPLGWLHWMVAIGLVAGGFGPALWGGSAIHASEIELENGLRLQGRLLKFQNLKLTAPAAGAAQITVYSVVCLDNGWQRYFVPVGQVPNEQNFRGGLPGQTELKVNEVTGPRPLAVDEVGPFSDVTPFNEFGRRTVTLQTPKGPLAIVQQITRLTPDHVVVTGVTHRWEHGLALAAVPPDVIESLLKSRTPDTDPDARQIRVRFLLEAGQYLEAARQLESLKQDFPDLGGKLQNMATQLPQLWGRQVLAELKRRRSLGQHRLAEAAAKQVPPEVGPRVQLEVQDFLKSYEQDRDSIEQVRVLLGELESQLEDESLKTRLRPIRVIVGDLLNLNVLPRFEPFLKSLSDRGLGVEERLALAYSGFLLGQAKAGTDLRAALELWSARELIQQYLDPDEDLQEDPEAIIRRLKGLEGISAASVSPLLPLLPPAQATPEATIDQNFQVTVRQRDQDTFRYQVALPLEYDPQFRYPLLIVLRSQMQTLEQTVRSWAGDGSEVGLARKRGYIVIAPEYVADNENQYRWSPSSHRRVLAVLRDARRRFAVDSDRVFLAGVGMGGDAAFDLGMARPHEFAGVMPICGRCDHYCKFSWQNARHTAWYVVSGELHRKTFEANAEILDNLFVRGRDHDILIAQYLGRGLESYIDERPRLFDWMETHRRRDALLRFESKVMRKSDDTLFWLTAVDLPKNYVLPVPDNSSPAGPMTPMVFEGQITPSNVVHINSPAKSHVLRLDPTLVSFDKRLVVKVKSRQKYNNFVEPSLATMLDELRASGDRQRLVWALVEL